MSESYYIGDTNNIKTYSDRHVVDQYLAEDSLQPAEINIINKIKSEVSGKKILDIGVGGGRTIEHLLAISTDYRGIDYSKEMIDACKLKYPSVNLDQSDARDLSHYADNELGLVFFSFNGLDYINHDERINVLQAVYRILAPGGYFVFSSHNRDYVDASWMSLNPFRAIVRLIRQIIKNYRSSDKKSSEVHTKDYAIVWDETHGGLVTYLISLQSQVRQLLQAGFHKPIFVFNKSGDVVENDKESPWLYYCAQK